MDLQKLEQYADRHLSSFSGFEDQNYSGFEDDDNYTGENDDFVDFGGSARNFGQVNSDKMFTLNFGLATTSSNTTDHKIYVLPGLKWYPGAVGKGFISGTTSIQNINGGDALYKVTSIVPMSDLDLLYAWIAENPIQCYAIRIQTGTVNKAQLSEALIIRHQSAFRTMEEKYLYPAALLDQHSFQNDTVLFETPNLILSNQTQIEYNLKGIPGASITMTFFCGANINAAKALEKKVSKAGATFSKIGLPTRIGLPGGKSIGR